MTDPLAPPHGARDKALCSIGRARLCGLATGVLYFLAFPGIDLWPLTFVTWVPLLLAMRGRSARSAAGLAWISGITMTFIGFYWMLDMLRSFSGFSTPWCVALMAVLALYQGGRIALFGFLANRARHLGWWRGAAVALAFAVSELLYPLLFPWYFAATVHQLPWFTQLADIGGPIAVGWILFGVNYTLAELLAAHLEQRKKDFRLLLVQLGFVGLTLAYGALRIQQLDKVTAQAAKGRVGIVQANMGLFEKRRDAQEGLRRHLELSRTLEREGPLDLIVWSETSVAGGVYEERAEGVYHSLLGDELHTPLLFGALLLRDVTDARGITLFNSALMTDREGHLVGRYDKHALLAFGEYLPLGDTFPILYEWSANTGKFTAGKSFSALPLGQRQVSAHICYEDVLPSFINELVAKERADLLVNLTNDAWYGDTTQPWIHLALAKFRAIEHRRFFVRSTNSGVSAFIDATGRVLAHTGTFEATALAHEVAYLTTPPTLYERWGDLPYWCCALLLGVACVVPRERVLRRNSTKAAE